MQELIFSEIILAKLLKFPRPDLWRSVKYGQINDNVYGEVNSVKYTTKNIRLNDGVY